MVIEHLYALNQEGYIQLFKSFGYSELEWIKTGNPFLITHNLQEALLAAEKNNSQPAIENIMFNLAQSYEKNENFEDAIHWYKKCLSEPYFSTEVYQADILASIILNMICQEKFYDAEILMDRLSFIDKLQDTQLRESMTAVKYYLQAKNAYCLNHADTDEIQRLLQDSLCFIRTKPFIELDMKIEELYGDLAKRHENYTEAIESYERALGLATGKKSMSIIYNKLSEVYEKTGDERLAFENYSRYYQLSEELCRERSKQYSEYLLKIYNISDAENDIVQLKKKGETLTCSRNTDFLTGLNNRRYFEETV